jgi:tRNA(Ile)-lysidine synthase
VDKPATPAAKVSEAIARDARWKFMADAMRTNGVRVIALGHQLDDVAETMLMRLTRGSGSAGLATPRPVQRMADGVVRLRPLLRLPAVFLREMLRQAGVTWREDATNATDYYFRNRVRRRVLPALVAAARPNALFGFGDARSLLEEDDDALEAWLDELVQVPRRDGEPYDLSPLVDKPDALLRRAIHRWGSAMGFTPSAPKAAVDALIDAFRNRTDRRLSAGVGRFIELHARRLSLVRAGDARLPGQPWSMVQLWADRDVIGPRGDRLELRIMRLTQPRWARIRVGNFPRDTVAYLDPGPNWHGWLWVRSWQSGDRYRPIGASGTSKLQDMFVNRRVPRELRRLLPVVLNNTGNVLWVPGLPVADTVAIQPTAKLVVQLTYTAVPPMVNRPKSLLS